MNRNAQVQSIKRFLTEYPDDATSWTQATDELPDLYSFLTTWHNERVDSRNFGTKLVPVGKINCPSPAVWNQKYKAAIRHALQTVDDDLLDRLYTSFSTWFTEPPTRSAS